MKWSKGLNRNVILSVGEPVKGEVADMLLRRYRQEAEADFDDWMNGNGVVQQNHLNCIPPKDGMGGGRVYENEWAAK